VNQKGKANYAIAKNGLMKKPSATTGTEEATWLHLPAIEEF